MKEKIKEIMRWSGYIAIAVFAIAMGLFLPKAGKVDGAAVSVTAVVNETVTCGNSTTTVGFGLLTTGSIGVAGDATTTMSCNSAAGCTLNMQDAGDGGSPGLYKTNGDGKAAHLIASADATLTAGVEGYGVQVTSSSTAGTGGTVTLASKYVKTGNVVGGLTIANTPLASSSAPIANRLITVSHKAAISGLTNAGSYSDTITYSCTGN